MYHGRFTGTHYNVGYKWGRLLLKNGRKIDRPLTFALVEDKYIFAKACLPEYQKYFPEVLEEIQGIADGNQVSVDTLYAMLFCMYCFELDHRCTCFAVSTNDAVIFGRNSDFLVNLEKLYMNCLYRLDGSYMFSANTTAFVQMEDGINQHGFAAGLTFVYPWVRKPGLNAGMLLRYLLEKCQTTRQAIAELKTLPLASTQTLTFADKSGDIAVIECNPEGMAIIRPDAGESFVATANNFNSEKMQKYRNPDIDDWRSADRYQTAYEALQQHKHGYTVQFAQNVLAGRYGFICQYDRRQNADTVWSVVYDLKCKQIWRAEGNPSRKQFKEDIRMAIS